MHSPAKVDPQSSPIMNRCCKQTSDHSPALSIAAGRIHTLKGKLETAELQLQQLLSFRPLESPSTLLLTKPSNVLRKLGQGSLGRIFSQLGEKSCFKLPLTNAPPHVAKLLDNFEYQLRTHEAFDEFAERFEDEPFEVAIPRPLFFADPTNKEFWDDHADRFDWSGMEKSQYAMCMEKISPIPSLIFDSSTPSHSDKKEHARAIGTALAILHWQAKLDGNGVEFLYAKAPSREMNVRTCEITLEDWQALRAKGRTSSYSFVLGYRRNIHSYTNCLWMLDFDACSPITLDEDGARRAVTAFSATAACAPRPQLEDSCPEDLWHAFETQYQRVSEMILPEEHHALPALFLKEVVAETADRAGTPEQSRPASSHTGIVPSVQILRG